MFFATATTPDGTTFAVRPACQSVFHCMVEAWEEISKSKLFKFKNIPMPVDVATGYSMSDLVDGWEGGGQALSATEMREQMEENTNE